MTTKTPLAETPPLMQIFFAYCSFHVSLSNAFLVITFILFVISSWNFHNVRQRFLYNQDQNFSWIRQKLKNFPIYSHCKKLCHVVKSQWFLQWGSMRKGGVSLRGVFVVTSDFFQTLNINYTRSCLFKTEIWNPPVFYFLCYARSKWVG